MKHKLTAVSLFCFSILYLIGGWELKLGTLRKPGPGLFPRLIGVGLLITTGIYLWQTLRKDEESKPSPEPVRPVIVASLAGAILVYPLLLYYLNFIPATFAVIYFMLIVLKFKGPVWNLVIAFCLVIIGFVVFAMGLGVSLSVGPIEEILFQLRG
jgi:hypothetical protein